jgi:hypothetical protein
MTTGLERRRHASVACGQQALPREEAMTAHEPRPDTESGVARTRPSDHAAVIGVVIAGVLASFVIPGPYDWAAR